jgi:recombination protein RecT
MTTKAIQTTTPGQPTVLKLLQQYQDQIRRALPRHMSAERMVRIVMTEIRRTPDLLKADPASLFGAVIQAAQLGLEPGINGQAYLVPFRNNRTGRIEVQFIPGYKGLMDLARRSGNVKKIVARVVRAGDEFEFELGTEEYVRHRPRSGPDAPVTAAYAVAVFDDGTTQIEVMSREEIDRIRARSKAGSGPWVTDYEEMAKKTVARRLCKYLPASVELQTAVALDEMAEAGQSQRHEAWLQVTPLDAVVEDVVDDAGTADAPAGEGTSDASAAAPAQPRTNRTEMLKQKLAGHPASPAVQTEAPQPTKLVVLRADGTEASSVATAVNWLGCWRALMQQAAPEDRPLIAQRNLPMLRDLAERARQRGHETVDQFARELQAAEALAASVASDGNEIGDADQLGQMDLIDDDGEPE